MEKFTTLNGLVVPLDRANVDTDAIIPKQFLTSVERSGFGVHLFDAWRYHDEGVLGMDISQRPVNHDFVLNHPRYQGAQILLARANFGCGSSREHAPWALTDYGFKVIIAPSFADIFFNNSMKNGLLCITLGEDQIDELFTHTHGQEGFSLHIHLEDQCINHPNGSKIEFEIEPYHKHALLNGLDDIGLTLQHQALISDYEAALKSRAPWLFTGDASND